MNNRLAFTQRRRAGCRPKTRITIMTKMHDIAEKTGLNISTVSRALRDASDISPETISLVKKTAMQMGYRLRTGGKSSTTVGLIVPEVGSHYYSEMVETVERELKKRGYSMIVCIGGFDVSGILTAFDQILHHDICGLIVEKKEEMLAEDIEALIAERQAARKEKNFARADEIRKELLDKGIILEDTREGVKWKRA